MLHQLQDIGELSYMSKIANAFNDGKAFIGFLTAGDPTVEKTIEYILAMEEAGCDLIEIGIPFSDPMAEGVVIQDANIRALSHNTTTDDVFEIVRKVRQKTDIPLVFLTYINPVFFYGYEKFFKKCGELGIDGIISPDLPYEEKGEIKDIALANDVDVISLIAPTSKERIQKIAGDATEIIGFEENVEFAYKQVSSNDPIIGLLLENVIPDVQVKDFEITDAQAYQNGERVTPTGEITFTLNVEPDASVILYRLNADGELVSEALEVTDGAVSYESTGCGRWLILDTLLEQETESVSESDTEG